jgi:SAM-dependent methyltransferase
MQPETFDVMAAVERDHWWFQAKRELVAHSLSSARPAADLSLDARLLDVGCGTGATISALGQEFGTAIGTDLDEYALCHARRARDSVAVLAALAEALPFPDAVFDALVSLDVVEHVDDDVAALREYRRVLRPGAPLVLTVPAYMWAWSEHDVTLGHRRRYRHQTIERAARAAGLEVIRVTYFHSWLVPIAWVMRRTPAGRLVRKPAEEASYVGPKTNRMLRRVARGERSVLDRTNLPVGLSLLVVARRPGRADPG